MSLLDNSIDTSGLLLAPYAPASDPDRWSVSRPAMYPIGEPLDDVTLQIASSLDATVLAVISGEETLYVRTGDPMQVPPPAYYFMNDFSRRPMKAKRVATDVNPSTGEVQLAALGGDQRIWHRTLRPGSGWNDWSTWGEPSPQRFQATDLALSIDGTGTAHFAAVGLDHHVYYRMRFPDRTWSDWTTIGDDQWDPVPELAEAVAVSASANGWVDLYLAPSEPVSEGYYAVFRHSKPPNGTWGDRRLVGYSQVKLTDVTAGRAGPGTEGYADMTLVVATSGPHAPVSAYAIVDPYAPIALPALVDSGRGGLTVCTAPDGRGIGYLTWR